MMRKMIVFSVALILSFVFCSVSEAKSLKKGEVYRSLDGREVIEIISSSELEITERGTTFVAEYDFKGDKLRVVTSVVGTKTVRYYLLTEKGLKDEKSGEVYYTKSALKAALAALEEKRKRELAALEEKKRVELAALEEKRKRELAALEEQKRKAIEELKKTMVFVKGGCYQMGDTFGDGESDEKPVHEVCVDDLYMGKYEVTQIQWVAIMGNNPSHFKGCDNCPVEQVSWNDIQDFIQKLNQKTGNNYRLPTEAEWEYAARSGGKNEKYAGGNDIDSVAWHYNNSGDKTHPVGQKNPNGLGIYDMTGNVWEWVQDWYAENYYKNSPRNNPKGGSSGTFRVLRGGSWYGGAGFARAANRVGDLPGYRGSGYGVGGFRVLRPAQ